MHLVASTTVENFKLEGDIIQLNFLLKMSKQINPEPMSSHTAPLVSLGSCCLLGSQPVPSLLQGCMILQISSYIFFHRWWTSYLLPMSLISSVAVVKASLEDAVGPSCRQWFPAILESWWRIIVEFRSAFHSSSSFQKIVLRLQGNWIWFWDLGAISWVIWKSHRRFWIRPSACQEVALFCAVLWLS